ncbi:MAG: phosphodiester glycosidase family protein [Bacteroidales bacterium]|nr:phosphodiester glycosidase family protein [Bacteroidales bacterium]
MNQRFLLFLVIPALALSLMSCNDGTEENVDNVPAPFIQSISTEFEGNKAVAGKPVTLNGLNFSPVASDNKVIYGIGLDAVALRVSEASEDRVVFNAPSVSKEMIKVKVSTKGKESNSVSLMYTTLPVENDDEEDPDWSDEPTIVLDGATTVSICPGVEWTSFEGTWEGQARSINIVRTTINEHNSLGIYFNYSHNGLDNLDEKCEYLDAVAGTNGPMACCQFVRVDGAIRHQATDTDYWIANCALTIDGKQIDIVKVEDNYEARALSNETASTPNTLTVGCAGPLLVWKGKVQSYPEEKTADFLKTTHPRTAIGLSKDGKTVIQVAVDGRWSKAVGMTTPTLSKLMRGLGCYKAMNFDGGGGTAMWVYGKGDQGIVNHPCDPWDSDGKRHWDEAQASLRATGNAVYIKSDLKQ